MTTPPKPNPKMLEALVCPISKGKLTLNNDGTELIEPKGKRAYPIREGIPILLPDEARIISD